MAVGIDPFVARSALHEALSLDGRVEPVLLSEGADLLDSAFKAGATVLITSGPVEDQDIVIAILTGVPAADDAAHRGERGTPDGARLTWLTDLLTRLGSGVGAVPAGAETQPSPARRPRKEAPSSTAMRSVERPPKRGHSGSRSMGLGSEATRRGEPNLPRTRSVAGETEGKGGSR